MKLKNHIRQHRARLDLTQQHVRVLDVSDLNNPAVIGTFSGRGWYEDLAVAGKYVYCAAYWGLVVLDQNAGSLCGDVDGDGGDGPDISDLVYLVSYMFDFGPPPPYPELADVDGSGGNLDIADLVYLVDYMFMSGPPPICQ